ncbi:MAG: T9SS type A sorting domain-containing protein [Bacteroidota bacterium]
MNTFYRYCIIFLVVLPTAYSFSQRNVFDSLLHQDIQRHYIVHLPPAYDSSLSVPTVIILHGGSGNYQTAQGFTQMNLVSNQNQFLAIYPQGAGIAPPGFSWADGRGTTADQAGIDDVGFISKLIDQLAREYNIDTNKVYACGFSNGGFMTQKLACELPSKFAAIGGLGCSMDISLIKACNPMQAVPMAYFSGTADPEVPFTGGPMRNPAVLPIVAVDTAIQFWVKNNNCQESEAVITLPNTVTTDNSTVELVKFTNCDCEADVVFYKIINGGHTWPGVPIASLPQLGVTNEDIHASFELWDFFDSHNRCDRLTALEEPFDEVKINIYPNPAKERVFIESNELVEEVVIFDLLGKMVLLDNQHTVNIKSLQSGIYIVRLRLSNNRSKTFRLVKE